MIYLNYVIILSFYFIIFALKSITLKFMKSYIQFSCVFLFTFFFSCKKEKQEIQPPSIPQIAQIELLEPNYPTDGGLNLGLKINSVPEPLSNIGILIARDSTFKDIVLNKNFELPLEVKTYNLNVKSGLELNSSYYYTYFINNKISTAKSDLLKFTFGKESKLKIDSISMATRSIGDTLRLYGDFEGFQLKEAGIGNVKLQAYKKSDKIIYMPLTDQTPVGEQDIYLHSTYQKTVFKDKFSLSTAQIIDFPKEVKIGEEVKITGTNFSKYRNANKLFINDEEVAIKSFGINFIQFVIPNTIKSATLHVNLKCNNQNIAPKDNAPMRIKRPEVVELPSEIAISDFLSVTLKDLPKTAVQFFIDGYETEFIHRSDDDRENTSQISWSTFINNYTNKSVQLEVRYLDEKIKLSPSIRIKDPWFIGSNEIPFNSIDMTNPAVVVNNTAYILANNGSANGGLSFWKFNKTSENFTEIKVPFACENPKMSASKNKIYLYTGNQNGQFYELDPSNNTFKELEKYPGIVRTNGTINRVNNKLYMVTGHNPSPYPFGRTEGDRTMYSYDIANNKWEKSVDFPENEIIGVYDRMRTSSFVIGSKLFVIGGSMHTGQVQTYAFDTETKSWETKADLPLWVSNRSSLGITDYGYAFLGPLYRYTAARNTWEQVLHIIPFGHEASNSIAFVLDDQLYYSIDRYNKLLRVSVNELKK